jgi:hypothetical protein
MPSVIDHSVHGLVTIRLVDAPRVVAESLVRELGPSAGVPGGAPDITVTFTGPPLCAAGLRFLEVHQAAYDAQHFYLLDDEGRYTRIALDTLGEPCEFLCEPGVSSIPLLVPMVGLCLLRKGYVLLHAAAFVYRGRGCLVTGWQKGGKTEMLLPFMAAGARYVADEWTIVGGQPPALSGLAGTARLWNWHVRELPRYGARLDRGSRLRLRAALLYQRFYRALPGVDRLRGMPFRLLHELSREGASPLLGVARQSPDVLFPGRVWHGPAPLDRVFLAVLAPPPIGITPVAPHEIAARMVSSLAYERGRLLSAYQQFRFAFPARSNALIETAREREERLLAQAFAGVPAYEIRHPYPVHLADLYRAAASFAGSAGVATPPGLVGIAPESEMER